MENNEWNDIKNYCDLPSYDGTYEFKDKEGNIEEIFIDINDDNKYNNLDEKSIAEHFIAWRKKE